MNENALYNYVSRRLYTNIRLYQNNKDPYHSILKVEDDFFLTEEFRDGVFAASSITMPLLACINENYFYGVIIHPEGALLVGPVFCSKVIHMTNGMYFSVPSHMPELRESGILDTMECLLLLHNCLNSEEVSFEAFSNASFSDPSLSNEINRRINDIRFEYNETDRSHHPLQREERLINAIMSGDIRLASEASMENIRGEHGTVSENVLNNNKSLAIVGITIASRAAIRAGVDSEVALSLTDSYIQEVHRSSTLNQLESVVFNCNLHLTRLVNERNTANTTKNLDSSLYYSNKAKSYISNHLHSRLTVSEIAEEIGITPNYLSNLFRKSEGMSLSEYILNEKISMSKNMILYSDLSLSDIAMTLGFSSQSHFSNTFRNITGVTPHDFKRSLK